jgi:transcriptional regulator with XRE-family HTH domain
MLGIAYRPEQSFQNNVSEVRHDIAKRFGQRVRKARVRRKLSQEALAAKADLDRAFLSGIERGAENPSLFTIQAIADALETRIGNLMRGI